MTVGAGLDFPMVLRGEDGDPAPALGGVDPLALPEDAEVIGTAHEIVPPAERLANAAAQFAPRNRSRVGQDRGGSGPRVTGRYVGAHNSSLA